MIRDKSIVKKILKIFIVLTCFTLFVAQTSCSNIKTKSKAVNDSNITSMKDLSFYDSETKSSIAIGMTKKEVDKKLGTPEKKDTMDRYNYQGLQVFYRNGKVASMTVHAYDNKTNRFKTINKIGLGNLRDDVIRIHKKSIEDKENEFLTYYYENKDNRLVNANEDVKNKKNVVKDNLYCFSYLLSGNNSVVYISIGDYKYAMEMK